MYTTTLAPPLGRLKGNAAPPARNTLRDCAKHSARLRAARPGGIYRGQGGACSSKRGATFDPLWHSGIFPDPTLFENPRFLENVFRLKIVSKIDLAGSRRSFSDFPAFLKNAGQYSPKDPFAKGGRHIWSRFCTLPDLRVRECSFSPILSTLARRVKH